MDETVLILSDEFGSYLNGRVISALRVWSRDMVTNPQFAELLYRGYQDYETLADVDKWRFDFWVEEVLTHRMTAWKYAEEGLLDAEEVETWRSSTCAYLAYPGVRQFWEQDRPWLRADFRDYVEQSCLGDEVSR